MDNPFFGEKKEKQALKTKKKNHSEPVVPLQSVTSVYEPTLTSSHNCNGMLSNKQDQRNFLSQARCKDHVILRFSDPQNSRSSDLQIPITNSSLTNHKSQITDLRSQVSDLISKTASEI